MKREVVEMCPHCDIENVMEWDVEEDGYKAFCPHCGHQMMLCDECCHEVTEDNPNGDCIVQCDWYIGQDGLGHCRRNPEENIGTKIEDKTTSSVAFE